MANPKMSSGTSGPIRQPKPSKNGPHSEKTPSNSHPTVMRGPIRTQEQLTARTSSTGGVTKRGRIRTLARTLKF